MKKLYLKLFISVLFFFSATISQAQQPYHKFLDNSSFYVQMINFTGNSSYWIRTTGDSIVNNKVYKKLVADPSGYTILVREDSSLRRVLMLHQGSTTEDLLYDFSLVQGSIVPLRLAANTTPIFYRVYQVDSVLTTVGYRKRLQIEPAFTQWGKKDTWIEGVGAMTQPIYFTSLLVSDPDWALTCVHHDSIQVYHNPILGACPNPFTITNTSELEQDNTLSNTQLYPNPATGEINIQLDGLEEVSIDIYTMAGQLIYHQDNINAPLHSININNKAAGVYLAKIRSKQYYKQLLFVKE